MPSEPDVQHIADVRILKQGYVAACTTCDWLGPEHQDPDQAVEDARAHEKNPLGPAKAPGFLLKKKIRRRL